jgi:tetratricopeptide (TPR) repeat protein
MSDSHPPLRDSYEGLLERAQTLVRAGRIEDALATYRRLVTKLARLSDKVLARRPELGEMHRQARLELTGILHSEGRHAEAIEIEEVLLTSHPAEADTWRTDLAIMTISKGDTETGLAELRTLADHDPANPARWLLLGSEYRAAGRFPESAAALDTAEATASEGDQERLAEIYYHRFLLLKETKQPDQAAAAWEEAVGYNAEVGATIRDVYDMFTDIGRYNDAQAFVERDQNPLQAGYQRGLLASLTGNSRDAARQWRGVAALDPSQQQYGHDAWVESVLRMGDPDPALEWLQENLTQYGTPRLLVLSGIGWAMRKDQELATGLFQQAINMYRRSRPPKAKLDSAEWRLLDTLVTDDELKTALKPHFAVVETLWG